MSCYICGRGSCSPCFHTIEEQQAYEKVEEAYDRFIEIREECRKEYEYSEDEDEEVEP